MAKQKIDNFKARKAQIENNPDLSETGKQRQLALLKSEIEAGRSVMAGELSGAWRGIKAKTASLEARRKAAAENEARNWDYQRLGYETMKAGNLVRSLQAQGDGGFVAASPTTILTQRVQELRRSGDKHALRALCEQSGAIRSVFGHAGLELARNMEAIHAELTTTPELQKLETEQQALITDAQAVEAETGAYEAFYGGDAWSTLPDLREGCQVREKYQVTETGEARMAVSLVTPEN